MDRENLLDAARQAALHAYAPYSHFRVGAVVVVETDEGQTLITGANVENASYGLAFCAERNALSSASALYAKASDQTNFIKPRITFIAVACIDAGVDAPIGERTPCGACRQWFAELAPDATIYIDGLVGEYKLDDLLPIAFRLDH